MNCEKFKYPFRAAIASCCGILMVILTEALSIYYVLCFNTVLDIINNFIKLKILASFDDFFVEPFKNSSMRCFIGVKVEINRFRKDKIIITKDTIKSLLDEPKKIPVVNKPTEDLELPKIVTVK